MATIVTHQPRPVPAFRRQHSASIIYPSSLVPNQSQISLSSTMDLPHRLYTPNRPPPHSHRPIRPQQHRHARPAMTQAATTTTSFSCHSPPPLSSSYPLVYSPSEGSYQNIPSMSADIQQEYPFDVAATGSSMNIADLDLSQSALLNPGQLPRSVSKSKFKLESSPASQPDFYADSGSYAFYNDSNGNAAIDSPSSENEAGMDGDLDLRYPTSSPSPRVLPPAAVAPTFVHPSDVMSPSPPAFGAPVPLPRGQGSSSPPGLIGELPVDEDLGSESGESDAAYPSDSPDDDDDDGDFMPSRMISCSRARSRRTSSVSVSSDSGSVRPSRPCRLSAPVPVPNLTKKSRGRRIPTAPVFIVQGGVQKNMRMYRCNVEGCYKCFARGEHLKRHVRSIHPNKKPHKCPVEGCGKDFSRHDNLGQHMRVHKGQALTHLLDDT